MSRRAEQTANDARRAELLAKIPHPYVTDVDGYEHWGGVGPVGDESWALRTIYRPDGTEGSDYGDVAFVLQTEADDRSACGAPIAADVYANDPELSCDRDGGDWIRTSALGHEVGRVLGEHLVRAGGPTSTPIEDLRAALDNATLLPDDEFEQTLRELGVPD